MANNFLVFVALGAVGWIVANGSPSHRSATLSSSPSVASASTASTTISSRGIVLEARQDPVPLVRRGPLPLVQDTQPASSSATAPNAPAANAETQAQDGLGRSAAQTAAEADGYKRVTIVGKGSNGSWSAKGYRGTTGVLLTVDRAGRVSMN